MDRGNGVSVCCWFIDRVTGFGSKPMLTTAHMAYTDLMPRVTTTLYGTRWSGEELEELGKSVQEFRREAMNVFGTACSSEAFM